jgi:Ser/Thr protein kinase RdoA (MazF antagonist)
VAGYRDVAELPAEDEAMLTVFVLLRRILLTAWIASHAETPTAAACGAAYSAGTVELAADFLAACG